MDMDEKLVKGLASAISLEQSISLQQTQSGRIVEVPKMKMTQNSAGRVQSMEERTSCY